MDEVLFRLARDFLCHRLAERSFDAGGVQSLLCYRCTGLWLGCLLGFLFVLALPRPMEAWRRWAFWAALVFFCPALDVAGNLMGLWPGMNLLRYMTGLAAGLAAGFLTTPIFLSERKAWETEAFKRVRVGRILVAIFLPLTLFPLLPWAWAVWVVSGAALAGVWIQTAVVIQIAARKALRRWEVPWSFTLLFSLVAAPGVVALFRLIPGWILDPAALGRGLGLF